MKEVDLTEGPILGKLIRFALPMIAGDLVLYSHRLGLGGCGGTVVLPSPMGNFTARINVYYRDGEKNMLKFEISKINPIKCIGKILHCKNSLKDKIPFDPEKQYAVLHVSICAGEAVAGFKNYSDGHFTEVMLIRNADDEKRFKEIYGLEQVKKEY